MAGAAFRIGDRRVGPGEPVYLIAEAGVNHNGDLGMARRLVDAAASCRADAVKFQTFHADALATPEAGRAAYQRRAVGDGSQLDMLRALELGAEDHRRLQEHAARRGLEFLSTPFDEASVDLLAGLGLRAFKVGSGDMDNHPLLRRIASHGRPVLLSTGMADLAEVKAAAGVLEETRTPYALLHCTSAYPARAADLNLRAMAALADVCPVVGYSDHTEGVWSGPAAVALGASILEKHLTLDRSLPGPDHAASLEPAEFAAYVDGARNAQAALGDGVKRPTEDEAEVARVARKSVVTARPVRAGRPLAREDLSVKRPGTGIRPPRLEDLVGLRPRADLPADHVLRWEDLEGQG